ncbi:30S ribosomal protein S6 alpha, chloroplastic [Vigna unguiculata]|uniref:Small subunit ribosomal protein S6 n=1 Tax=Vigna unguiculata TaxID=3917 RepID=A0A4D6L9D0_VIGUN|nr:30S ribosomal protein S6 alpha, chloroplastic [Vigna unguiculata]QCD85147.1 small subunit ribosomal protein S6 [Vigna unguiculata]
MASSALTSVPLSSSSLNVPHSPSKLPSNFLSSPIGAFSRGPTFLFAEPRYHFHPKGNGSKFSIAAQTLDFSDSFFEGGFGSEDDPNSPGGTGFTAVEEKEEPPCPPGLRQYETMMVLRPDMTEDERLALTQKYEEILVAGGGMYVEVFNRGVIPLAYGIKKKNKAGETNTYLDGIYLLFTYFTKPESVKPLEETVLADDNVIRSMSFKVRKRKY